MITLYQHALRPEFQAGIEKCCLDANMQISKPNSSVDTAASFITTTRLTGLPAPQIVMDLQRCECWLACVALNCAWITNRMKYTQLGNLQNCNIDYWCSTEWGKRLEYMRNWFFERNTTMGYVMVLTDRTDDNEDNHYNDDNNDDDTRCMVHDCHSIYGTGWPKDQNLWGLHYFTGYWSMREVKFHQQGRKYDNKGWMIIWSYHFILFPFHTWPVFTWMENFVLRCFRIHMVEYLIC